MLFLSIYCFIDEPVLAANKKLQLNFKTVCYIKFALQLNFKSVCYIEFLFVFLFIPSSLIEF